MTNYITKARDDSTGAEALLMDIEARELIAQLQEGKVDKTVLDELYKILEGKADKSTVDKLSKLVDDLANNKADKEDVDLAIKNVVSKIDGVSNLLNGKIDSVSLSLNEKIDSTSFHLNNKIGGVSSSLSNKYNSLAAEVDTKADKSTVEDLANDVSSKADKSTVEDLANDVSSKADKSTVESLNSIELTYEDYSKVSFSEGDSTILDVEVIEGCPELELISFEEPTDVFVRVKDAEGYSMSCDLLEQVSSVSSPSGEYRRVSVTLPEEALSIKYNFLNMDKYSKIHRLLLDRDYLTEFNNLDNLIEIGYLDCNNYKISFEESTNLALVRDVINISEDGTSMFKYVRGMKELLSIDTSKVKDMGYMFAGIYWLRRFPEFDTSNVTNMNYSFCWDQRLVVFPKIDTSKVKYMNYMLNGCSHLSIVNPIVVNNVIEADYMFYGCTNLAILPSSLVFYSLNKANHMFDNCSSLTSAQEALSFTNLVEADYMFNKCSSLLEFNIKNLDNMILANHMFDSCDILSKIELSVYSLKEASYMFYGCPSLSTIKMGNTVHLVSASHMFENCSNLKYVEFEKLTSLEDASYMFSGCSNLEPLGDMVMPNLKNASYMFYGACSISSDIKFVLNINTPFVTNIDYMFCNSRLGDLDLTINISSIVSCKNVFNQAGIKKVTVISTDASNIKLLLDDIANSTGPSMIIDITPNSQEVIKETLKLTGNLTEYGRWTLKVL